METREITGEIRKATGKKDSKKLRAEEMVPCVLYGGEENIHFYVPFNQFRKIIYTPEVFIINLNLDGKNYQAILQDTQWHPVEEEMLHADFLQVFDNRPVKINLPVNITGTAKGIKTGGKLKVNLRTLKVRGSIKDMPNAIDVDVTHLGLSQSIKVGDLKQKGIELLNNKSDVIATIMVTRAARAAMQQAEKGK
ncbi:MAG: 50S ribosomal protein L25/general stress protein Ctc [Prolixibacteraceae bacterium]|nr:50S ribosomal protein L25/general stress protein Ctc [Prolixibacteraceae bacterium]